jgi:hypothetical protein
VKPRRRTRLEPADLEADAPQRRRELTRRRLAMTARRPAFGAHVNQPVEERARGDHHRAARMAIPIRHGQPGDASVIHQDGSGFPDNPRDQRIRVQRGGNPIAVLPFVGLCARRPDRRTAAAIQELELNTCGINGAAHQAAQRVDLPHEMTLRRPTDGWIAGHLPHCGL